MKQPSLPRRIVVAGGGTAGRMTAAPRCRYKRAGLERSSGADPSPVSPISNRAIGALRSCGRGFTIEAMIS